MRPGRCAAPVTARQIRSDLVAELERADGPSAWSSTGRRSSWPRGAAPRELEAQTSIKRGYLNLLHAREAIARHALEAQDLEADDATQKAGRDRRTRLTPPGETTPSSGILG